MVRSMQDRRLYSRFFELVDQGFYVFGETASAVSDAGVEKLFSNSGIHSHALHDVAHVRSRRIA